MDGPLARYIALQVPGATILGLVLLSLWGTGVIGAGPGWTIFALWVVKDAALYPFVRRAYMIAPTGAAELVGCLGEAREDLNPRGRVRIRGETWHAEAVPGQAPIRAGSSVRVESADGMLLKVCAAPSGSSQPIG